MPAIARVGDRADHGCGAQVLVTGSPNVSVNSIRGSRVTDSLSIHCVPPHSSTQVTGSPTVFVNGLPVARLGDSASCGSINISGSPNVFAG